MHFSLPRIEMKSQRVFSIDAMRGITIFVMIFVNELAGVSGLPAWMKHADADADAMTFVDVVFPGFLFIVGMSIPFAITRRLEKGDSFAQLASHILSRTIGLLILGVFMVNMEGGYNEDAMGMSIHLWALLFYVCVILVWNKYTFPDKEKSYFFRGAGMLGLIVLAIIYRRGEHGDEYLTPQWWGILGLIGWAYLFSTFIYLITRASIAVVAIAIVLCILAFALPVMAPELSVFQILKGIGGHATHTSIVLAGILLTLIFLRGNPQQFKRRIIHAVLLAVVFAAAGFILRPYFGISKIYATPPWALLSIASCIGLFVMLYIITDVTRRRSWTKVIQPAAANPLLAYIIPSIIYHLMRTINLHWPAMFYKGLSGIVWAIVFSFLVMGVVIILNKWKIKLQL